MSACFFSNEELHFPMLFRKHFNKSSIFLEKKSVLLIIIKQKNENHMQLYSISYHFSFVSCIYYWNFLTHWHWISDMSIGKNCAEFVFKIANDNKKNHQIDLKW